MERRDAAALTTARSSEGLSEVGARHGGGRRIALYEGSNYLCPYSVAISRQGGALKERAGSCGTASARGRPLELRNRTAPLRGRRLVR